MERLLKLSVEILNGDTGSVSRLRWRSLVFGRYIGMVYVCAAMTLSLELSMAAAVCGLVMAWSRIFLIPMAPQPLLHDRANSQYLGT